MKILVINGPNLNFLGIREKNIYGNNDYKSLVDLLEKKAKEMDIELECFQNNSEGLIIDKLQEAYINKVDGIIINPGAYTHYSYAIKDALSSLTGIPKIEVHISNIHKREEFRHKSVTAASCDAQMAGFGFDGYILAMQYLKNKNGV